LETDVSQSKVTFEQLLFGTTQILICVVRDGNSSGQSFKALSAERLCLEEKPHVWVDGHEHHS
jgi:hypothetical protein